MPETEPSPEPSPTAPPGRFLKLAPNYFVLTAALLLIVTMKVVMLRETTAQDFLMLGAFGLVLLIVPYLGAWGVWAASGKTQKKGEITFIVLSVILFLIPTIALYREAIAAR